MGTIEKDRILQLRGEDLYGSGVEKIGTVEEIYLVAEKRVVPKERVRLGTDVEVDERTVSQDVGGEDVEIDGIAGRSDRA